MANKAASASESVPDAGNSSLELEKTLRDFSNELEKLRDFSNELLNLERKMQKQNLISELEEWKLKHQSSINELLSALSQSYQTLHVLHKFLDLNLHSKSQALTANLLHPQQKPQQQDDVARTVLKKNLDIAKALLTEIREDFLFDPHKQQSSPSSPPSFKRMTLDQYLEDLVIPHEKQPQEKKEEDDVANKTVDDTAKASLADEILQKLMEDVQEEKEGYYFFIGEGRIWVPKKDLVFLRKIVEEQLEESSTSSTEMPLNLTHELQRFSDIRIRAVHAGIQLSNLLAQFICSLSGSDEATLEKLASEINKLAEKADNIDSVADKFASVMVATKDVMMMSSNQQKKKKKVVNQNNNNNNVKVVKQFCSCISDLELVLRGEIVPESWDLVEEAAKRIEVILGLMLYTMQGIKVFVGKNNHNDDDESWKILKDLISFLWYIEQYGVNY